MVNQAKNQSLQEKQGQEPMNQNFISMLKNCLGASEEKNLQQHGGLADKKDPSFNMIIPTQN